MALQEDYQIALNNFQGPLDLLLYLIRRAEVDIQDIPIARIADDYVTFLRQLDHIDVDVAGEFLVLAATLVEIKSRALMPPEEHQGRRPEDDKTGLATADPRYELVQQLLAYQRFRIASEDLDARREAFSLRYPAVPCRKSRPDHESPAEPIELDLEDVHVYDLSESYQHVMESIDFSRLGDHRVEIDDTPIELYQEDLLDQLTRMREGKMTLQQSYAGKTCAQRIGFFLAVLELVRQRRILVRQDDIHTDIEVELLDEPPEFPELADLPEPPESTDTDAI